MVALMDWHEYDRDPRWREIAWDERLAKGDVDPSRMSQY